MPLPTLGIPKYRITIPSTKKETTFRPFLVKEQKSLYMALESQNQLQILDAMCGVVSDCVDGLGDTSNMPMFDIEYMFLKIRAKSVGEIIDLKAKCPKCDKYNEINIDLDQIEVKFPENISNKIMLNEKIGIMIRYPSISDANMDMRQMGMEQVLDFVASSIETVFDDLNVYNKKDFTSEEIHKFVESMTSQQFELVSKFYLNIPRIKKDIECTCLHCKHEFTAAFGGLQDFFT
jgi:phage FluMu protein Com